MPRAKWKQEQITGILKQIEAGRTVVEVCRKRQWRRQSQKWPACRSRAGNLVACRYFTNIGNKGQNRSRD